MKSAVFKMICRFLVASMLLMSFSSVNAGMIGTDRAVASDSTAQADRLAVLSVLGRSEVASELQSMGLSPQVAQERVAAMTNAEVQALKGQIDSLPAGAKSSKNGWAIAAVIVIAVLVYYYWK